MKAARIVKVVVAVMWVLLVCVSARAGSAPDAWSGIITLDWSALLPEDSPLRDEVDRIFVDAHIEWTMWVHFKRESATKKGVRYTAQSATVDYLEVSHHDAQGRRGDATIRTLETNRLEASGRTLDSRTCTLVLWVNFAAKRFWIEEGGFELEDVPRSGLVLIEITDANGTRRVSEPATGDKDVRKPVRVDGRYTDIEPQELEGTFDANVEPPPGVDRSYKKVGGMVELSLFRGECPDVRDACIEKAERTMGVCLFNPGIHELDCDMAKIENSCFGMELVGVDHQPIPWDFARDCVKAACSVPEGASVSDSDFEADIDALMDCWDEYSKTESDCIDLCL